MNLCINWMNENNGFLMCIITAVYVIATVVIMVFNIISANAAKDQAKTATKQIEEMKKQQQQNAGIGLYAIRKSVLTQFCNKDYDGSYRDAVILFSTKVADEIMNTGLLYLRLEEQKSLIEEYENSMRTDLPNLYDEYKYKLSLTAEHPDDEKLRNDLFSLCDHYNPVYKGPLPEQEIVLNYRELTENLDKARHKYEIKQAKTLILINNELKQSIELK